MLNGPFSPWPCYDEEETKAVVDVINSNKVNYWTGQEGRQFEKEFAELRAGSLEGTVELEGQWGFTIDWTPTGWLSEDTWARIKLDAYVKEDDSSARVIDYKTGKRFGNEITHSQQCLLYAIGAFMK